MKLRALHLAAAAAATAAAVIAFTPASSPHAARRLAVIHIKIRPASPHNSQPVLAPAMMRTPQEQTQPLPSLARPTPTARPLRPLFPWWFRRRHVAVAQPAIA